MCFAYEKLLRLDQKSVGEFRNVETIGKLRVSSEESCPCACSEPCSCG